MALFAPFPCQPLLSFAWQRRALLEDEWRIGGLGIVDGGWLGGSAQGLGWPGHYTALAGTIPRGWYKPSKMLDTRYKVPVSGDGSRLFLPGKP